MRSRHRSVVTRCVGVAALSGLTLLSVCATSPAWAAKPGHGSVMSPAGAPLRVEIPLYELTATDLTTLKVSVPQEQAWVAAGLTSPAPLQSLSVSVEPGFSAGSRRLVVRSSQTVNRPVIDILLDVTLATGSVSVQSSFLVLVSPSNTGSSVVVAPGDTLTSIAQRYAVPGADLVQMLWALYQANPNAFISQNMNLLRAGANLSIPDAQTVLAVDAKYAYGMFLKHAEAFKRGRGVGSRPAQAATVAPEPTLSGSVKPPAAPSEQTPAGDQLRLSAATPTSAQEDAKVAAAQEIKEMQQRIEVLQQNLQQLRDAVQHQPEPAQKAQNGEVRQTARPAMSGMARVQQVANDNVLWVVLGASAVLALLMALMLRRAGMRQSESGSVSQGNAAVSSAFDQKLQSIDLNLDSSSPDLTASASAERKV
jgi:pilus assembly protein FimV